MAKGQMRLILTGSAAKPGYLKSQRSLGDDDVVTAEKTVKPRVGKASPGVKRRVVGVKRVRVPPPVTAAATSADAWLFQLPYATPPLTLNQRLPWRIKARVTAEVRTAAFALAKHAKVPKNCSRVRVTLIYRPKDQRRRDAINLVSTLKAVEDGLVDARVVADDTPEYIDPVMPQIWPRDPSQTQQTTGTC